MVETEYLQDSLISLSLEDDSIRQVKEKGHQGNNKKHKKVSMWFVFLMSSRDYIIVVDVASFILDEGCLRFHVTNTAKNAHFLVIRFLDSRVKSQ
jgi:Ni,Fe-hydrogenase maturation factor